MIVTVTDATGAVATGSASFAVRTGSAPLAPGSSSHPPVPGFWWGFGVATIAVAAVAVFGGYRLVKAREGEEFIRRLRSDGDALSGPPETPTGASSEAANTREE